VVLSYRMQASRELAKAVLALYAIDVSTRKISAFLEGIYSFWSPQKHLLLDRSHPRTSESLAGKAPKRGVLPGVWDRTFLSIRRGKTPKERVYMASGIKPNGQRETLGFWLIGAGAKRCGSSYGKRAKIAGKPRLMLFELPCVILSPFAATSTPRANCSGCQQRDKEATQVVEMCCRKRAVGLEPAG
jgi:hypothetical protein